MARGVNKVILVGSMGQDPEVRHTASGACVTNISIATNEAWKDKQTGEMQEKTEWHRLVAFGKVAEVIGEHATKGTQIYVEGKLQTRKYQKDGQDHYSTEVVINEFQFLGGGKDKGGQQRSRPAQRQPTPTPTPPPTDFDDDIPF